MFFSVIIAYGLATAFAFCGVVRVVGCIMDAQHDMGYIAFMESLSVAMWPLAVAAALVLLIQTATKLERWMLLWTIAQAPSPPSKGKPASSRPAPPAAPSVFTNHLAAVAPPTLAAPAPPAPAPETPADAVKTVPLPPKPATSQEMTPAPEQDKLNFFKLD